MNSWHVAVRAAVSQRTLLDAVARTVPGASHVPAVPVVSGPDRLEVYAEPDGTVLDYNWVLDVYARGYEQAEPYARMIARGLAAREGWAALVDHPDLDQPADAAHQDPEPVA